MAVALAIAVALYVLIVVRWIVGIIHCTKERTATTTADVSIAVVVAARNEETSIVTLLRSLKSQTYRNYEVIVVNDNSTDKTETVCRGFGMFNLRVIDNDGRGKKDAVRTGVNAASAELIVTTDADCKVQSGWLQSIATYYCEKRPDMIMGVVDMCDESPRCVLKRMERIEFESLQASAVGAALSGAPIMCNAANMAFRRDVYLATDVDGKTERSGDDVFLLHKIKENGGEIHTLLSAVSVVTTQGSRSLSEFVEQRARWAGKSRSYRDVDTVIVASVVGLLCLLMLVYFFFCIFGEGDWLLLVVVFSLKLVVDFSILIFFDLKSGAGVKPMFYEVLLIELFYPFYVVVSALGLFK